MTCCYCAQIQAAFSAPVQKSEQQGKKCPFPSGSLGLLPLSLNHSLAGKGSIGKEKVKEESSVFFCLSVHSKEA